MANTKIKSLEPHPEKKSIRGYLVTEQEMNEVQRVVDEIPTKWGLLILKALTPARQRGLTIVKQDAETPVNAEGET